MAIEVIAVAAGLFGLLLLIVASLKGPRERPRPPDRGVFVPGLYHFDGGDDDDGDDGSGFHHS